MAMKNLYEFLIGNSWTYTTSPNGGVSSTVSTAQKSSFQRYNVVSNLGDFVSPRAHQYVIVHRIEWNGTTLDYSPTSRSSILRRGVLSRTLTDTLPIAPNLPTSLYNKAYADMVEKVRGSVDLSIDLVQWRQTVQMAGLYRRGVSGFVEVVNRSWRSIVLFEKERLRRERIATSSGARYRIKRYERWYAYNLRKTAQDLARARLEYVYGWKPLASSIVGLGEIMAQPGNLERKVKARSVEHFDQSYTVSSSARAELRREKTRYRCEIQIKLKPIAPVLSNLARISSLNPASVAYEAFPFSFVLDWFLNIGGWLRNVETAFVYGSSFSGGFYNYGYLARSDQSDNFASSTYQVHAQAYVMKKFFVRVPLSSFPLPRFPSVEMSLGLDRSLNALALVTANASRVDQFISSVLRK